MRHFLLFACVATSLAMAQIPDGQLDRYRTAQTVHLTSDQRIATYEKLLKEKPSDAKVQAGLAAAFLQKLRETTDFAYLNRADGVVRAMLAANPKNYDAIRIRAEIETHRHNFAHAADLARELVERDPGDTGTLGMLGDSLMELGQYDDARAAYQKMLELSPNLSSYNRVAYHRFVTGNTPEALSWMWTAVQAGSPTPENLAWCLVEFGDMLFKVGRTADAHAAYVQSLQTLPGYHRAFAALGREALAAEHFQQASDYFQKAQAVIPLPDYAAALEKIYSKLGKPAQAQQQRDLLDVIDKLGRVNGEKGNRVLAVAYADESRKLDRALELAQGELANRKDVYTYDALSWVLFRSGKQNEAEEASAKAIAVHTPDPMLLFHAGMIAIAGGKNEAGSELLKEALALNPAFAYPEAIDAKKCYELHNRNTLKQ